MLRSCGTQPMPSAARASGASAPTSRPAKRDRAREAARHADQAVDQRRLADAVAAQHRQRLALAQPEGHVGQHDGAAIAGREVIDGEQFSHRGSRRDRRRARAGRRRSPSGSPSTSRPPSTSTEMRSREAEHQVHVVLDQQHRDVGRQGGDGVEDVAPLGFGHAGRRLVEQQHLRRAGEGRGDLEQALLAVGQGVGAPRRARRQGRSARPPA